jgi:homoprotocatechuate degradation regulator HpaR
MFNILASMRPFSTSLPMALLRARESSICGFRTLLSEHHVTEQQWRVLRALTEVDHPIDAGELADRTFLLAPSLSRILADLEGRGLIDRHTDPADQRRSLSSLSELGRKHVLAIAPQVEDEYARIEAAFGTERLHTLLGELYDFAEALDGRTATP